MELGVVKRKRRTSDKIDSREGGKKRDWVVGCGKSSLQCGGRHLEVDCLLPSRFQYSLLSVETRTRKTQVTGEDFPSLQPIDSWDVTAKKRIANSLTSSSLNRSTEKPQHHQERGIRSSIQVAVF